MNYSIVSVQTLQKFFAVVAVIAMVFGPMSNVFVAEAHDGGAAHTFTASVDPSEIGFNETETFTFTITNTSGVGGAEIKSFKIVMPTGFSIANASIDLTGWGIAIDGSNIEASDSDSPDWLNPGESAEVTVDVTHTVVVGGVSDWNVCAYKNNSFQTAGGALFHVSGSEGGCGMDVEIDVDVPVIPCDEPYTGNFPDCVPPPCPEGYTGTYPDCVPPVTPCPDGYTGTYPDCVPPQCPEGTEGTYPDCVDIVIPCDEPYTGDFPDCVPPACPDGYTGVYPVCIPPMPQCPEGWTGIFPTCIPPVVLVCTDDSAENYGGALPCVYDNNEEDICEDDSANNYGEEGECTYDEPAPACTIAVVSDETSTVVEKDGAFAEALDFIHAGWTAAITGATWIWGDNPVADPTATSTQTFVKTFEWNGPVTSALLDIASDNSYVVTLNGIEVANSGTDSNFTLATQDNDVNVETLGDIITGENTLSIAVQNYGTPANSNPEANPAGLLFRLDVTGNNEVDCTTVPTQDTRYTLDIEITGDGEGHVLGDAEDISCYSEGEEQICSATYPAGTVVDLFATADEGSNFDSSWTVGAGTCTGNNTPCQVTMNGDISLVAHFALNTPGYSQGSYGGGGNGRSVSLRDGGSDSDDEDEPEGQVLGEATSTMPVGAPNTGAGGASALSFSLHGVVAILASRKGVQVSNGK